MKNKDHIEFSTVLASSVHDMKNSVGMLLSSIEAILQHSPPANAIQAKDFSTLHYEASRINGELVQLLTLYRMDNHFLPLRIDQYYVIDVLEEQVARNVHLYETSGVQVELICDDNLYWYYDLDLIGGVIHNIIVNCIRYTQSKLRISAKVVDDFLCVSVADDGVGYPESMLSNPSHGVEDAQFSKGATHLGLYFADLIAGLHVQGNRQGFIELTNGGALGGGVFQLFIP